jgi:RNA polymerase sigma factor (sigma-70 family)
MTTTAPNVPRSDEDLVACVLRRATSRAALEVARGAFGELYQRHHRGLLAFLRQRVPPADVDEVHSAVWERAWEVLPERFHGDTFRAWLFTVARNLGIDFGRRRRPAQALDGNLDAADRRPDSEPLQALLDEERQRALGGCLKKLSPDAAAVVQARLGGEDYEELCARLKLPRARAYKLYHAALPELQDCVRRALS